MIFIIQCIISICIIIPLSTSFKTISQFNIVNHYHHNQQQQQQNVLHSIRKLDVNNGNYAFLVPEYKKTSTLLNPEEEISLAKKIRLNVYINDQRKKLSEASGKEVSDEEIATLLQINESIVSKIQSKGEEAKDLLVSSNVRLVFHIAKFYKSKGVTYADLVQEGMLGLMKAVERYDPDRGFRFSTYATWWIKQAVLRAIAEKSRIIRVPGHVHELIGTLLRVEKRFVATHMRKPSVQELSIELALPIKKTELLLRCCLTINSSDDAAYDGNRGKMISSSEAKVKDKLISHTIQPQLNEIKKSMHSSLRHILHNNLTNREYSIIEMRYGLIDGNISTLEDIGIKFNVTRERIRQIEAKALAKLRMPFLNDKAYSNEYNYFDQSGVSQVEP